jgi:hypothetical protein
MLGHHCADLFDLPLPEQGCGPRLADAEGAPPDHFDTDGGRQSARFVQLGFD